MSIELVPISQLPVLSSPITDGMRIAIEGAGVTYGAVARKLVLPADPLITAFDFTSSLPGSRFLEAGTGISFVDNGQGASFVISATGSGILPVYNLDASATLTGTQEDFNGGDWDGGLNKSRFSLTLGASPVLGGLDATQAVDGQVLVMLNDSTTDIFTITHDSGGSAAANRFLCPGAGDFVMVPLQAVLLLRKNSRWRIIT